VVTPNIVMPSAGRPSSGAALAACRNAPPMAPAALPSTRREMRFSPATSVTEYIMAMSDGPT